MFHKISSIYEENKQKDLCTYNKIVYVHHTIQGLFSHNKREFTFGPRLFTCYVRFLQYSANRPPLPPPRPKRITAVAGHLPPLISA